MPNWPRYSAVRRDPATMEMRLGVKGSRVRISASRPNSSGGTSSPPHPPYELTRTPRLRWNALRRGVLRSLGSLAGARSLERGDFVPAAPRLRAHSHASPPVECAQARRAPVARLTRWRSFARAGGLRPRPSTLARGATVMSTRARFASVGVHLPLGRPRVFTRLESLFSGFTLVSWLLPPGRVRHGLAVAWPRTSSATRWPPTEPVRRGMPTLSYLRLRTRHQLRSLRPEPA
jgi:hypothetical protein